MLILAGLGNPGKKYAGTRHNIGFMAVDEIARRHGFSSWRKKFQGLVADGVIAGETVLLVKPQTYMNESGRSVGEALRFHGIGPDQLIVFYDELDLAPGKVRVKKGGGAGGHNGIRSIDAHCGKDYRRIRLGIGHPGDKQKVTPHVLGTFAKADSAWLDPVLTAIAENVDRLARGDGDGFMNKVAVQTSPTVPKRKPPASKGDRKGTGSPVGGPSSSESDGSRKPGAGPMADVLSRLFGKKKDG